jgi:hypothetical protein
MTQEEKKLLLQDLCARLPYGVKVNVKGIVYENRSCRLTDIHHGLDTYIGVHDGMQYHIESIKPYLFPLSSMTEEQYYEMNICSSEDCVEHFDILKSIQEHTEFSKWPLYEYRVIDFFHKNHFDYRGLIEKGLAIDATGLNIY